MKKMQRILSILLVLTLMLSVGAPAMATQEDSVRLSMVVSQTSVAVGDKVSLTIQADRDFTTRGSGMTIYYDDTVLELDLAGSTAAAPLTINGPVKVNGRTAFRISFLPGLEQAEFSAAEALAVVRFKALTASQQTILTMGGAYLYDSLLREIPVSTAAAARLRVTRSDAGYTVKMPGDTTAIVGEIVQIPVVIGNEDGETGYNAFDIDFTYDPQILKLISTQLTGLTVTAAEGNVNVLGYGPDRAVDSVPFTLLFEVLESSDTLITVTSAGVDNSGNVTVSNTSRATPIKESTLIFASGYPVTLPEGFVGGNTAAPNEDYTFREPEDYFDYTVSATVGGVAVEVTDNGDGSYTIPAELVNGEIVITAARTGKIFNVTLGTDMQGNATAQHGVDYTAMLRKDENYSYRVTVSIGGNEYTGYAVFDDSYVIPGGDITGDIVFTVVKEELTEPTEPEEPTVPTEPEVPTVPTEPETPTVPSEPEEPTVPTEPEAPTVPTEPDTPTVPTEPDTPPTPTEPVTRHPVTFTGSGAGAAQGNPTSVAHGSSYTLTLKKETGYSYQVSYIMGGRPAVKVSPNANGTYTIANVTAPLQIVIEKTLQTQISVNEYLTLDEKVMFLIQVTGSLDSGKVFTFDGEPMFYSEAYGTWVYLWITEEEFSSASAGSRVATTAAETKTLKYSAGDVNQSGTVNVVDAKLISDLYNGIYEDFLTVNMIKFLNADIIRDKKLDVRDVAAVIDSIVSSKEG